MFKSLKRKLDQWKKTERIDIDKYIYLFSVTDSIYIYKIYIYKIIYIKN